MSLFRTSRTARSRRSADSPRRTRLAVSRAMANALVIAHTTTEDHLKALLAKTGSVTRHQLLARALGG